MSWTSSHEWLDKLMVRVNAACYPSLTDRRWFQDRPHIIAALTAPAAMARNFNWDVTAADVQAVATKTVEALERFQEEAKKQKQVVKYPPAFLRTVAEREVKLASDNWKQATVKPSVFTGIVGSLKVSDVDVLASVHNQIAQEASKAKKSLDVGRPVKSRFVAEQFEMRFA